MTRKNINNLIKLKHHGDHQEAINAEVAIVTSNQNADI